jgi:hypothetical protein
MNTRPGSSKDASITTGSFPTVTLLVEKGSHVIPKSRLTQIPSCPPTTPVMYTACGSPEPHGAPNASVATSDTLAIVVLFS